MCTPNSHARTKCGFVFVSDVVIAQHACMRPTKSARALTLAAKGVKVWLACRGTITSTSSSKPQECAGYSPGGIISPLPLSCGPPAPPRRSPLILIFCLPRTAHPSVGPSIMTAPMCLLVLALAAGALAQKLPYMDTMNDNVVIMAADASVSCCSFFFVGVVCV